MFAAVQSLFGVGLLVFGTPTLLLLGVPYVQVLGILLPCSVTLSLAQVLGAGTGTGTGTPHARWTQLAFCVPFLVIGLWASLSGWLRINLEAVVAFLLLLHAALRCRPRWILAVNGVLRCHPLSCIGAMSFVHGISNMGGGLLTLFASSVSRSKAELRAVVSRFYLVFGAVQVLTLCAVVGAQPLRAGLILAPLAVAVHWFVGDRSYRMIAEDAYQKALTFFIAAYGAVLLGKVSIRTGWFA